MTDECRATFITFLIDIYGTVSREGLGWMKDVQLHHLAMSPATDDSPVISYRVFLARIAIAVQAGNAQAAMACTQAAIDRLVRLAARQAGL